MRLLVSDTTRLLSNKGGYLEQHANWMARVKVTLTGGLKKTT